MRLIALLFPELENEFCLSDLQKKKQKKKREHGECRKANMAYEQYFIFSCSQRVYWKILGIAHTDHRYYTF